MASGIPKFVCISCGHKHTWKAKYAGKKAKCGCGATLRIPLEEPALDPEPDPEAEPSAIAEPEPQAEPMPQPEPEPVVEINPTFSCPGCGKEHRWKPEIAGKKGRCKCGHMLEIPATAPGHIAEPEPLDPEPAAPEQSDYDLSDKYAPAAPVSANAELTGTATCPSCSEPVPANAVLCVNCGYHLKDGKTLQTQVHGQASPPDRSAPASAGGSWFSRLTKRKPK